VIQSATNITKATSTASKLIAEPREEGLEESIDSTREVTSSQLELLELVPTVLVAARDLPPYRRGSLTLADEVLHINWKVVI
jgi:hypothetical protein